MYIIHIDKRHCSSKHQVQRHSCHGDNRVDVLFVLEAVVTAHMMTLACQVGRNPPTG